MVRFLFSWDFHIRCTPFWTPMYWDSRGFWTAILRFHWGFWTPIYWDSTEVFGLQYWDSTSAYIWYFRGSDVAAVWAQLVSTTANCLSGNTGPWFADNKSRDRNKDQLLLVVYLIRSPIACNSHMCIRPEVSTGESPVYSLFCSPRKWSFSPGTDRTRKYWYLIGW